MYSAHAHISFLPSAPPHPQAVSASGSKPVATSALLAWCLCQRLHPPAEEPLAWLAVLGTIGDLGAEGLAQFGLPLLAAAHKGGGKGNFGEAVSMLNAGERVQGGRGGAMQGESRGRGKSSLKTRG